MNHLICIIIVIVFLPLNITSFLGSSCFGIFPHVLVLSLLRTCDCSRRKESRSLESSVCDSCTKWQILLSSRWNFLINNYFFTLLFSFVLKIINLSSEIALMIIFGSNSNSRELIHWVSEWDQLWNFWFLCLLDVQGISFIYPHIRCDRWGNFLGKFSGSVNSLNDYSSGVLWVCAQFTNVWTTQKSDLIVRTKFCRPEPFSESESYFEISTSCWWDFL